MSDPIHLALVHGSNGRRQTGDMIARWAWDSLRGDRRFDCDEIDPKAFDLAGDQPRDDRLGVAGLRQALGRADAFLIVTPEYNRSYPAALKALIEPGREEWRIKPVAFVSYGGVSGGLRAVEHLRLVFAELEAVTVRETVSFADAFDQFDLDGALLEPRPAARRMERLLGRLHWWADVLRAARRRDGLEHAAA